MDLRFDTGGLDKLEQQLTAIQNRIVNHRPAMEDIGSHVVRTTQDRIVTTKQGPDGKRWAAGSTVTERMNKGRGSLLYRSGALARSVRVTRADATSVTVTVDPTTEGGKRNYAPYMQNGVKRTGGRIPGKTIPARPFLGLSDSDKGRIVGIMNRYIQGTNV